MIGWCRECNTVAIEPIEDGYDVVCNECRPPVEPNWMALRQRIDWPSYEYREHFAYTMSPLSNRLDELYIYRTPRTWTEYNTVDLAALRRERGDLWVSPYQYGW